MANCDTPKVRPQISAAGQISLVARNPANAQISQNGTITENRGNWRPTIAPNMLKSSWVDCCRPVIGAPSAPKATGAVLAISDSPAAARGEKPRLMRIDPVIATGVPKPDDPSKKAPTANAISNSCSRRSFVTATTDC